jgi:hypothetical protein
MIANCNFLAKVPVFRDSLNVIYAHIELKSICRQANYKIVLQLALHCYIIMGISKNWLELQNWQIRNLEARFCTHLANMELTRCVQGRAYECEMQFLVKFPVFRDTLMLLKL